MDFSKSIKELREKTGAGFMDCKTALQKSDGNLEKAIAYIQEKSLSQAEKKLGRVAKEGRIHSYIHGQGKVGVLVEINCETDFVARTEDFQNLAQELALQITALRPLYISRDLVPEADKNFQNNIFLEEVKGMNKPLAVTSKIVEGKMNKWFSEVCLIEQPYVKDPEKKVESIIKATIAKVGENIIVQRFVRFELGEGRSS